mmetsp:Transcript_98836/g.282566  ORF Transcript_98836/g.282566 Transcript_98836/m.282566 type:complete len:349 (-) Transcript_98836:2244-3290(-)
MSLKLLCFKQNCMRDRASASILPMGDGAATTLTFFDSSGPPGVGRVEPWAVGMLMASPPPAGAPICGGMVANLALPPASPPSPPDEGRSSVSGSDARRDGDPSPGTAMVCARCTAASASAASPSPDATDPSPSSATDGTLVSSLLVPAAAFNGSLPSANTEAGAVADLLRSSGDAFGSFGLSFPSPFFSVAAPAPPPRSAVAMSKASSVTPSTLSASTASCLTLSSSACASSIALFASLRRRSVSASAKICLARARSSRALSSANFRRLTALASFSTATLASSASSLFLKPNSGCIATMWFVMAGWTCATLSSTALIRTMSCSALWSAILRLVISSSLAAMACSFSSI